MKNKTKGKLGKRTSKYSINNFRKNQRQLVDLFDEDKMWEDEIQNTLYEGGKRYDNSGRKKKEKHSQSMSMSQGKITPNKTKEKYLIKKEKDHDSDERTVDKDKQDFEVDDKGNVIDLLAPNDNL